MCVPRLNRAINSASPHHFSYVCTQVKQGYQQWVHCPLDGQEQHSNRLGTPLVIEHNLTSQHPEGRSCLHKNHACPMCTPQTREYFRWTFQIGLCQQGPNAFKNGSIRSLLEASSRMSSAQWSPAFRLVWEQDTWPTEPGEATKRYQSSHGSSGSAGW